MGLEQFSEEAGDLLITGQGDDRVRDASWVFARVAGRMAYLTEHRWNWQKTGNSVGAQ